jgi:peptidoglycan/LPS O-acetylase OafA/YrhL
MAFTEGDSPFIGVTWSLAVEEQFYLFFPLVVFMLPRRILPLALFVLAFSAIAFRLYFHYSHGWHPAFALTLCRMDSLFIGALAAWYTQTKNYSLKNIKWLLLLTSIPMAFFTVRGQHPNTLLTDVASYTFFALFYCALLLTVISDNSGVIARLFRIRFLMTMGTYAYAIYLVHVPVIGIMYSVLGSAPLN